MWQKAGWGQELFNVHLQLGMFISNYFLDGDLFFSFNDGSG